MKARLISGFLVLTGIVLLNSCGKDPEPNAGVSFEVAEEETTESDGTTKSFSPLILSGGVGKDIQIKVLLDKASPDNVVLSYTVAGTASRAINGNDLNDFNLNGANAKATETLIIEAGATEGIIDLTIYEDDIFEVDEDDNPYETIVLTLDKVVSGHATIDEVNNSYTLKINEDDALIFLQWDAEPTTTALDTGDVDMDIFAFLQGKVINAGSYKDAQYEYLFIPGGYPDDTYSIAYTYYSGTSANVKFGVHMFGMSLNNKPYLYPTEELPFSGTYTQSNINKYDLTADVPNVKISQTLVKSKLNFTVSPLTNQTSGSRVINNGPALRFMLPLKLRATKLPGL